MVYKLSIFTLLWISCRSVTNLAFHKCWLKKKSNKISFPGTFSCSENITKFITFWKIYSIYINFQILSIEVTFILYRSPLLLKQKRLQTNGLDIVGVTHFKLSRSWIIWSFVFSYIVSAKITWKVYAYMTIKKRSL